MPGRSGGSGRDPVATWSWSNVDRDRALAGVVAHLERAAGEVDAEHLVPQPHVDAVLAELRRGAGDEVVEGGDVARHEVRDAAGRVARPRPFSSATISRYGCRRRACMAAAIPPASPPITTSRSATAAGYPGGPCETSGHGRAEGLSPLLHPHHALRRHRAALPGRRGRGGAVRLSRRLPLLRAPLDHRRRLAALRAPRGQEQDD